MVQTTCTCGNKKDFEVLTSSILGNPNELILHQMIKCLEPTCGRMTYLRTALDASKVLKEISRKDPVEAAVAT